MARITLLLLTSCLIVAAGCEAKRQPILQLQFCVKDDEGVKELKDELVSIANAEQMNLVDGSDSTKRGMKIKISPVVYVSMTQDDNVMLMAGNLFLPRYQIYISIFPNKNAAAADEFASRVQARVGAHWVINTIPPNKAAFPMKECRPSDLLVK
jgi:hypothetical protein